MRSSALHILLILLHFMLPARAQLGFNEVMAVNSSGAINPVTGEADDWIEIYNGSPYTVDLAGYCLSDDRDEPLKWNFPDESYLAPGSYHLVWADGSNSTAYGSHTNFKLGVEGETLFLHDRLGVLYDSMAFPAMHEDISYGYSMDGSALFFKIPTPGGPNNNGSGFLYAGSVVFEPAPAVFGDPVEVHLSADTPGGSIRYTLDGSPPGPDDPVYTAPIMVSGNRVIRAQLWVDGFEPGAISTASYIIHEPFTLPVVSVSTDPHNLWDDRDGIYVEGSNGRPGYCMEVAVNWNMDWERPLSFEYFDLPGVRQLQFDGGTKIHGGCSRVNPMKSLAVFARSRYGSNRIEYPLFSQKEADSFKGLILRNSGNDFQYTLMRDAIIQAVVDPVLDVDCQAYEPVQVFLNGEYWGIHNLREKVNEHWVTSNYGIPAENLDFIKNKNEVFIGHRDGLDSLNYFLRNNDLVSAQSFQQVADWVDLESHRDFLFTQLFFANRDWPGNNIKYWRDRVKGSKWRWILFDLDYSMGIYQFDPSIDMLSFATVPDLEEWPNPAWSTLLFRRLLENESYREEFIKKYLFHLNTSFAPERVNQVIDSFYYRLNDIFPAHIARWGRPRSMDDWNYHVDLLRLFADERPGHVRENLKNFFSLGKEVRLEVKAPELAGQVKVNGMLLPQNSLDGTYNAGLDLDLEFQAAPGYSFESWEVVSMIRTDTLLVPRNSTWKYNDTGIDPGDKWKQLEYDDSTWPEGAGELGYGDGGERTLLSYGSDEQNKIITSYFRHLVDIGDPHEISELAFKMIHDDGAVVYINGTEVIRYNLPSGDVLPGTMATSGIGGENENRYFEYIIASETLHSGTNLIAVEIHQVNPSSSDLSFDLELSASHSTYSDTLEFSGHKLSMELLESSSFKAITTASEVEPNAALYINEFMASNQGAFLDEFGESDDWIELYNADDKDWDLAGLYLTDDLDNPAKWRIPSGSPEVTTIGAKDHLLLFADEDTLQGPLHLNFKLSSGGESIGLSAKSGEAFIWLDSIYFGPQQSNTSFGRYPDGNADWVAMNPLTPREANQIDPTSLETEILFQWSVFPNPTRDWLNVRLDASGFGQGNPLVLSLFDLTGRRIEARSIQTWQGRNLHRLDLSELPSGVYILTFESESGLFSKKIIKADR